MGRFIHLVYVSAFKDPWSEILYSFFVPFHCVFNFKKKSIRNINIIFNIATSPICLTSRHPRYIWHLTTTDIVLTCANVCACSRNRLVSVGGCLSDSDLVAVFPALLAPATMLLTTAADVPDRANRRSVVQWLVGYTATRIGHRRRRAIFSGLVFSGWLLW